MHDFQVSLIVLMKKVNNSNRTLIDHDFENTNTKKRNTTMHIKEYKRGLMTLLWIFER